MNFEDIQYRRPDIDVILDGLSLVNTQLDQTHLPAEIIALFQKQNSIHTDFITRMRIAEIRNLADLKNQFYEKEVVFLIDASLKIDALQVEFYKTLLTRKSNPELEHYLGDNFFSIINDKVDKSHTDAVSYKKKELHLINDYKKLEDKKKQAASLFIQLAEARKNIALHTGYETYTDYSYAKKGSVYTRSEILDICRHVRSHISVINSCHNDIKAKKLGVSHISFKTTNTIASGLHDINDMTLLIKDVSRLLRTASGEIADHFDFLVKSKLVDYSQRDNKYPISMNVGLPALDASFIFATQGRTGANVVTLLHEMGHAFQFFKSLAWIKISHEYMRPTADIAELQACSMELFFYDDYSLLFQDKAPIVQFILFEKILFFILKSCAYEELQQFIYSSDILTTEIINQEWLSIRQNYYPFMDADYFEGDPYFIEGNEWQSNFQIFTNPFNEFSYTVAYLHALDHLLNFRKNKQATIDNFECLCTLGGSVTYREALKICNLSRLDSEAKIKELADIMMTELSKLSTFIVSEA